MAVVDDAIHAHLHARPRGRVGTEPAKVGERSKGTCEVSDPHFNRYAFLFAEILPQPRLDGQKIIEPGEIEDACDLDSGAVRGVCT